ncbi:hypothetical protein IH979_02960, partial [Patescibacteria group bacterium]|nr:hypothetical protein [Patescibacteria group bacterium]
MVAPARAIEPTATLARDMQAARRARAGRTAQRRRGQVLRFPVDRGPIASPTVSQVSAPGEVVEFPSGRKIEEEQMYKARPVPERLGMLEAQNKANLARERQRIREQTREFKLPTLAALPPQDQVEFQPRMDEFADRMRAFTQRYRKLRLDDPARRVAQRAKQEMQKKMKEQIEKFIKDKLLKKYGRRWAWRLFGRGSVTDTPGETAWIWWGFGAVVTLFQGVKTFIKPSGGDFMGGFLSWLEPSNFDLKESTTNPLDAVFTGFDILYFAILV